MKVVDSMWVNTMRGHFGLIVGEDETTGERRLYAGAAIGLDQKADEKEILKWGSRVNIGLLEGMIAKVKKI